MVEDPVTPVVVAVGPADDAHDGEVLAERPRDGVDGAEPADGERDGAGADPAAAGPGVPVGRVRRVELVAATHEAHPRGPVLRLQLVEEGEVEVPRHGEHVAGAHLGQAPREVPAQRGLPRSVRGWGDGGRRRAVGGGGDRADGRVHGGGAGRPAGGRFAWGKSCWLPWWRAVWKDASGEGSGWEGGGIYGGGEWGPACQREGTGTGGAGRCVTSGVPWPWTFCFGQNGQRAIRGRRAAAPARNSRVSCAANHAPGRRLGEEEDAFEL